MDITNEGMHQIMISGLCLPQLHASTTKSALLHELRKTQGNLYDSCKSMSVHTDNSTTFPNQLSLLWVYITHLGCGSSKKL